MSKKILIVDDNYINRRYARSVLSKAGIEAIDVASGYDALELLSTTSFELILLDIQMPELDGFETLIKIKSDFPHVECPILAITAFYGDDGKTTFIDAGFQDYVRKPIKPQQLIQIVEKWMNLTSKLNHYQAMESNGVIDINVYKNIKKYTRDLDINDLYIEFELETTRFLRELKILISTKNYPKILSILHIIKGNSGSLGVSELAVSSEELEADIKSNKQVNLKHRYESLEGDFLKFKRTYRQILKIQK